MSGGEVHGSKDHHWLIDSLSYADYNDNCEAIREQIRVKHSIPVIPRKQK